MDFPIWSDLGNPTEAHTNPMWEEYVKYFRYYTGEVFDETLPVETENGEEDPKAYPVGLNLVKMLCLAQTDAEFGEWEDQSVQFGSRHDQDPDDPASEAIKFLNDTYAASSGNSTFWEVGLDRNIYGGGVFSIKPFLSKGKYIRWLRIPTMAFEPVFDPDDPNILLSATVETAITKEQALLRYGIKSDKEEVVRKETWDRSSYTSYIDGQRIDAFSGVNPWGVVPYVYIPRMRSSSFYGDALTADIMEPQDELNSRVADLGEAINYNAHPIRWGLNLPKSFNTGNYALDPDGLWDLGRVIGSSPEPKVGMLEAQNPVPNGVFTYINFLYDWMRTSSFAPPIAFGEDSGSQRSGVTLEIRMWPLIKSVRRSRSYLTEGILRMIEISARILKQKNFSDISAAAIDKMLNGEIVPVFAEIMPRDHQAAVDEVVKLLSTEPPSISLETAQKILGRSASEVDRIKKMMKDKELWKKDEEEETAVSPKKDGKGQEMLEGMRGKQQPQAEKAE